MLRSGGNDVLSCMLSENGAAFTYRVLLVGQPEVIHLDEKSAYLANRDARAALT